MGSYPWWAFGASSGGSVGGGNIHPPGPVSVDRLRGASLYGQGGDPEWDYRTFAHILSDCGLNFTCWWLWGGWRDDGMSGSSYPFLRSGGPGSPWDLMRPNPAYFERQIAMVEYYRSYGVRPLINFVDLYPWSAEKAALPGIPNPDSGPFRHNINGVKWGVGPGNHPDDPFYLEQPDGGPGTGPGWLKMFIEQIVGLIGDRADYQTGNECPESGLHDRIRDVILRVCPTAKIASSRNNDSPGQFYNMVKTHRHDAINFHGWKNMDRMHEKFGEEHNPDTGRPDNYADLFAALAPSERRQIIACSDGARSNSSNYPYDLPALFGAFEFAWQNGANIDHQSGAKMVLYNEGRHDLSFVEVDFLKQLGKM